MNNYSELQATNFKLNVCIELEPIGAPDIVVLISDRTLTKEILTQPKKLEFQLDLLDLFSISIELQNKIYTLDNHILELSQHYLSLIVELSQQFHNLEYIFYSATQY